MKLTLKRFSAELLSSAFVFALLSGAIMVAPTAPAYAGDTYDPGTCMTADCMDVDEHEDINKDDDVVNPDTRGGSEATESEGSGPGGDNESDTGSGDETQ